MAERKEMFEWKYRLEKKLEEQQEYWDCLKKTGDKLLRCMQERDKLILEFLEQTGTERQRDQEAEFQEKLEQVAFGICGIREGMEAGFEKLEQKAYSGQSMDAELTRCRDMIDHLQSENDRLKEDAFQAEKKADPEVKRAEVLYARYKAWTGKEKLNLSRLSDENVLKFYKTCSEESRIGYIFQSLGRGSFIWEEGDRQGLDIINDIIDFCIEIRNQDGKQLRRQKAAENDKYNPSCHMKNEAAPATGDIKRVLLQGIEDEDGQIYDKCRAFVEIGDH